MQEIPMFKANKHYSRDLEAAVIGACLMEPDCYPRLHIKPEHCYFSGTKLTLEIIYEMGRQGLQIDLLTVVDYFYRVKKITKVNNLEADYFLSNLTKFVCSSSHLLIHQHILICMARDRERLINRKMNTYKPSGIPFKTLRAIMQKATKKYLRLHMEYYGKETIEGNSGQIINVPNTYCVFIMHLSKPQHTFSSVLPGKLTMTLQDCKDHFTNKPRIS